MYGLSVSSIGDLDNDGIQDLIVGAYGDDTGGTDRGAVYIHYMNRNGSIKSTVKLTGATTNGATLADADRYGYAVAQAGDLDSDGIPDVLVGTRNDDTGGTNRGAAYIHYMNRNGSIKSTVKIASGSTNGPILVDGDLYGCSVNSLGDLDADGIPDIGVGAFTDDTGGTDRGAVYIHYMNRDGSIKSTVKLTSATANGATLADTDFYGSSVASLGDLDNDGITDIGVGALGNDTVATNYGALFIHYMDSGGSIKSTVKLSGATTNGATLVPSSLTGAQYGQYVTSLGDLNNDGAIDLAVGALIDSYADGVGNQTGRVFIHFMQPVIGTILSQSSLLATEGGFTGSFTFKLKSKPTSDVTVSLGSNTAQTTFNTSSLTFTSVNWNTPQTVTVTAVDDSNVEGSHSDTVLFTLSSVDLSYNALSVSGIPVTITDNDSRRSQGPRYLIPPTISNINQEAKKTETIIEKVPEVKELIFTKTLKLGSRDKQVILLQKFLNENQYTIARNGVGSPGKETSYFGKATKSALMRFQKANDLVQDGITGPLTRAVLNK